VTKPESGATIPKPPNLVRRAKSDHCSAPGESRAGSYKLLPCKAFSIESGVDIAREKKGFELFQT